MIERKQFENALVRRIYREILLDYDELVRDLISRGITPLTRPQEWKRATKHWDKIFDEGSKRQEAIVSKELARFGVYESERAARGIGVALGANRVSPALMTSIMDKSPIDGLLLREWFASESAASKLATRRAIQAGLSQNETIDQLERRLRGKHTGKYTTKRRADGTVRRLGIFRGGVMERTTSRHARAIVRTATTEITNRAHHEVYSRHPEVTTKYEWVSVLDGRTSDICIARSGKTYPYGEGPVPPAHINCRSVITPVIPGAAPSISASESGPTAASNYQEWLKEQSAQRQNEILGPTKAQMFRDGKLDLKQLVDREGRSRTVAQLQSLKGAK